MKLVTFYSSEGLAWGMQTSRGILPWAAASTLGMSEVPATWQELVKRGAEGREKLQAFLAQALSQGDDHLFLDRREIRLGPCVPRPGKILCVGLNYRDHAREAKMEPPKEPVLFNKFATSLAADGEIITIPAGVERVDYEAELALVIGKRVRQVSEEQALQAVFGYCNANDLSARELQFRTSQWLLGKCLDQFCPLGPYLVTADEVGDPQCLTIRCLVNGELRQEANTADMIFSCAQLIHYISRYMTLEPGDVILTGTPQGVILGYPPEQQVWLKEGDEVVVEIEKLGRLTNRFQKARIPD